MPKVSFILPAYKRRFLREAIASILAQTYRDFELVVVDDCSPEDLKSVVDEFHDERMTYHRNETNIGGKDLVAAWNHAMEFARGEWCVLASDDDVYLPGFLDKMMKLVEKYPNCDLFHCRIRMIDADGHCTRIGEQRLEFESQLQIAYAILSKCCAQALPDFMFRKTVFFEIGGFVNFPCAWGADDATWMLLAKHGVGCSSEILFSFRNSGENISSKEGLSLEKFQARMMFYNWLKNNQPSFIARSQEDEDINARFEIDCINPLLIRSLEYLNHVSLKQLCLVAKRYAIRGKMFRGIIYARYPRLKAFRVLFPHWR